MRTATLTRLATGDEGTYGELVLDTGFRCYTLELPYRDVDGDGLSDKGRSCIPAGTYTFRWRKDSPKHGECYEMDRDEEAPNRAHVQIHAANLAGDASKGFVAQLEGCIAPGASVMTFRKGHPPAGDKDQKGVSASKSTLKALEEALGREPVEIVVKWAPGVAPGEA